METRPGTRCVGCVIDSLMVKGTPMRGSFVLGVAWGPPKGRDHLPVLLQEDLVLAQSVMRG